MIASNLRAGAYRAAAIVSAALAVAAILLVIFLSWRLTAVRADTGAEKARADTLAVEVASHQQARVREALSDQATEVASAANADQLAQHYIRAERAKGYVNATPVPAECPMPSADILRELAEGRARVSAAEDRLRNLLGSAGGNSD